MRESQVKTADPAEKASSYEIAQQSYTLSLLGGALKQEVVLNNSWSSESGVSVILTFPGVVPAVVRSALEVCINSDRVARPRLFSAQDNPTELHLLQVTVRSEFIYAPVPDAWGINE